MLVKTVEVLRRNDPTTAEIIVISVAVGYDTVNGCVLCGGKEC